jgi:hypothetical protein
MNLLVIHKVTIHVHSTCTLHTYYGLPRKSGFSHDLFSLQEATLLIIGTIALTNQCLQGLSIAGALHPQRVRDDGGGTQFRCCSQIRHYGFCFTMLRNSCSVALASNASPVWLETLQMGRSFCRYFHLSPFQRVPFSKHSVL